MAITGKTKINMTAEQIINEHYNMDKDEDGNKVMYFWSVKDAMIEFAKYHVKQALKEAAKRTNDVYNDIADLNSNCNDYEESITEYIENCYNDKIK